MTSEAPCVLTLNGGSSSIRFAVFEIGTRSRQRLAGKIDRIGLSGTSLRAGDPAGGSQTALRLPVTDHRTAASFLMDWLGKQSIFGSIKAVGHRVVHGMKHAAPERVTPKLLAELKNITPYDPDHMPREIALIEAISRRHPNLPQVACFDTAFHRTMPPVAKRLPIPRRYGARGVERYGFHGLSYAYLMEELVRLGHPSRSTKLSTKRRTRRRVILAHLGSGASLAAVRDGKSIDTSMGFTPTAGLMMSTRTGDLDPGVAYYLARTEHMTAARFQQMVNHESGLLGVSGTSSDMRDLCARQAQDSRAAEAVALFCYQVKKWIGSFAAALGGLDTLVFAGGIGENAPLVREQICEGLGFLGIQLGAARNAKNAPLISPDGAAVEVRVIPTDEEIMIARSVTRLLQLG
jgi:acetate kinase